MKKILIYSLVSLGDVIMATSIIPLLRQKWPDAKIGMMVRDDNAAVVLNNPHIDIPLVFPFRNRGLDWKNSWRMLKALRKHRFDLSISMDRHKRGAILNWLAGIPVRVGPTHLFDSSPGEKATRFYTHLIKPAHHPDFDSRIGIMQDIVQQYLGKTDIVGRPSFGSIDAAAHQTATRLLNTLPPATYRVGLCMQGSLPIKSWPAERFAALVDHLHMHANASCYFIGTESQRAFTDAVIQRTQYKAANFCGMTTLQELGALLLQSDALAGIDTGTSHLAAALNAPLLTLFGNFNPRRLKPTSASDEAEAWNLHLWSGRSCSPCEYWNPEECPHQMQCMYDLSVEKVAAELQKLFDMAPRIQAYHQRTSTAHS